MCLDVTSKRKFAIKDIVVYKRLKLFDTINGKKYETPYKNCSVEIGKTYKSKLIKDCDNQVRVGLHSYVNLNDAIRHNESVAVKCIIPKFSWYYEGLFDCGTESYASTKLKYIEIINS